MRFQRQLVAKLTAFTAIFALAVAFNYPWELVQSRLFVQVGNAGGMWWHCLLASLGDGILVLAIYVGGWWVFRHWDWFERPDRTAYGLMLVTGAVVAVVVEWVAVYVMKRWAYTSDMPLVPGLAIGLVPILQMVFLPPVIFFLAGIWAKRQRALSAWRQ